MPTYDGVRRYGVQRITPLGEHALHQDPEHAVAVLDLRPGNAALEDRELMAKRNVLEHEPLAVFDEQAGELQ